MPQRRPSSPSQPRPQSQRATYRIGQRVTHQGMPAIVRRVLRQRAPDTGERLYRIEHIEQERHEGAAPSVGMGMDVGMGRGMGGGGIARESALARGGRGRRSERETRHGKRGSRGA